MLLLNKSKMMKLLFVLILSCSSFISFSQLHKSDSIHWYTLEEAKNTHSDSVFAVKLSKKKLTVIPKEIQHYKNLRHLDLSKNKLTELPEFLSTLPCLIDLNLGKNKFTSFPTEICKMTQLKRLVLNENSFTHISECVANLEKLTYIDLWDTPLETFPNAFLSMKNLRYIDMRGIVYGPTYQQKWIRNLHWVKIEFDAPCDCMEK
jgi:Leucine-rich repeat (LRR) protein